MRCKKCKELFEPKYFLQKMCMVKDECIKAHVELSKKKASKEWKQRKKVLKEELTTVQQLMKLAQVVFNTYIRERDKGQPCISCDTILGESRLTGTMLDLYGDTDPKKYDCGHYYSSGGHKNLTYHTDNNNGQCVSCNRHKHGNLIEYRKRLIKKIGIKRVEWLDENAHVTRKYSRQELKDLIEEYKKKTKELKNKSK